ncbi:hypothetical protein ExPECSC057_00372 [Escherichia coli]|nr:hypothetical protein ExPECSC057_00372 [Escherichia coli]
MTAGLLVLCKFVIHIVLRCHNGCAVYRQAYGINVADDNNHAAGHGAPGAFRELGLVAFCHAGHRNQGAGAVIQSQLTHPEAANFRRNNQFRNHLIWRFAVLCNFIQRPAPDFIDQGGL